MYLVPTVRYFASARAAAGVNEEVVPAETLGTLRASLAEAHGERLAAVLRVASFLVDGLPCRDPETALPVNGTVDVLPPFAGG
ncbi:MAG TPA: MoaD/ThiS family protein [Micromonosporaceae bacterium]|jgi:molybdopterin converting factor small subunit